MANISMDESSSTSTITPQRTDRGPASPPREPPSTRNGDDYGPRPSGGGGSAGGGGSFLKQYKPEQGKSIRMGTVACGAALAAWGSYFLYERLQPYEGDEAWRLLITPGIPILFLVVMGGLIWWASYVNRTASDFMIATEGEMKKVNWSSRREVIGSTKVVILFSFAMALYLFVVDVVFQTVFQWIGVLKIKK